MFAEIASVIHNKQLRKIFRDKVSAGKSKKEALINISKKLAAIVYSVFRYNKPYKPNRVFITKKRQHYTYLVLALVKTMRL